MTTTPSSPPLLSAQGLQVTFPGPRDVGPGRQTACVHVGTAASPSAGPMEDARSTT